MPMKMVLEEAGRTVDSREAGTAATVRLAVGEELQGVSGRFFDGHKEAPASAQAYDDAARKRLWELSESLTREV